MRPADSNPHADEDLAALLDKTRLPLSLGTFLKILDDFESVLSVILDIAIRVIPAEAGSILSKNGDGHRLYFKHAAGPKEEAVTSLDLDLSEGVAGWVATHGEAANVPDVTVDPRYSPRIAQAIDFPVRSLLCAPLRLDHEVVGAIELINRQEIRAFRERDLALLSLLSERVTWIIEKARSQREKNRAFEKLLETRNSLARKIEELGVLYEIERKVNSTLPLHRILDIVTEVSIAALHAEAGSIYVLTEEGESLCFETARGSKAAELERIKLAPGEGFAGYVVAHREPLIVNDVASDARHRKDIAEKIDFPVHNMICVPMMRGERCIGAYQVINRIRVPFAFTNDDLVLLQMIASQAAKLIENHWMAKEKARSEDLAALGRFVSSILHDIRSPLATISGFAEVLGTRTDLSEEARDRYLGFVQRDVTAIETMADEILEFAKGDLTLKRREIDLNDFLVDFRDLYKRRLQDRPIEVLLDVQGRLRTASIDPMKIERAFLNLCINAADAMDEGGTLTISAETAGGKVIIRFLDTGPGIPERILNNVFEPFVSGKGGHAGLGLSIVCQIVKAHGGTIEVDSKLGSGTTFTITLPTEPPTP